MGVFTSIKPCVQDLPLEILSYVASLHGNPSHFAPCSITFNNACKRSFSYLIASYSACPQLHFLCRLANSQVNADSNCANPSREKVKFVYRSILHDAQNAPCGSDIIQKKLSQYKGCLLPESLIALEKYGKAVRLIYFLDALTNIYTDFKTTFPELFINNPNSLAFAKKIADFFRSQEAKAYLDQVLIIYLNEYPCITLPEEIATLSALKFVNMTCSRIQFFPFAMKELKELDIIEANQSQLRILQTDLGLMNRLQVLDVSATCISELPAEISKSVRLKKLRASFCNLKRIPEEISALKRLTQLDLSNNLLHSLPCRIGKLKQLKTLNLCSNHLNSLPRSFAKLTYLTQLDISNNKFQRLPCEITDLRQLRSLFAGHNHIQTLDMDLMHLSCLKLLDLSRNKLRTIPLLITHLTQLKILDVSDNQMRFPPAAIFFLMHLELLNFEGNPFHNQLLRTLVFFSRVWQKIRYGRDGAT